MAPRGSGVGASRGAVSGALERFWPYGLLLLATAPNLAWVLTDRTVWPWDQAWYAQVSVDLYHTLRTSPSLWLVGMVSAFGIKAPGLAWLGQFVVPVGELTGSTNVALLLFVVLTDYLVLVVIYKAIVLLSEGRRGSALAVGLLAASAPMFVAMAHQYLVEPLQTLSVAWFVLIMAAAPRWSPPLVMVNLVGAASLGMLAKATAPAYCVGPGLVALVVAGASARRHAVTWGCVAAVIRRHALLVALSAVMLFGALKWYTQNWAQVVYFVTYASSGSAADLYGTRDTLANKLGYWLGAAQRSFVLPAILAVLGVGLVAAALLCGLRSARRSGDGASRYFGVCAAVSAIQIAAIVVSFALQVNQENRYLLPLLPLGAVVVAWSLAQIRTIWAEGAVDLLGLAQLGIVSEQALGMAPPRADVSYWVIPVQTNPAGADRVRDVVRDTCGVDADNHYTIVGVELPWFNANSLAYVASRDFGGQGLHCYYTSLGYAEGDADRAWDRLHSLRPRYFVTVRLDQPVPGTEALNQVSDDILRRVATGGEFQDDPVASHADVELFRAVGP